MDENGLDIRAVTLCEAAWLSQEISASCAQNRRIKGLGVPPSHSPPFIQELQGSLLDFASSGPQPAALPASALPEVDHHLQTIGDEDRTGSVEEPGLWGQALSLSSYVIPSLKFSVSLSLKWENVAK